jgi:hypothetical protein
MHRRLFSTVFFVVSLPAFSGVLAVRSVVAQAAPAGSSAGAPEILPLAQVQPGMKGVAYTIYSGDTVEKIPLTVIGVLPDVIAPRASVILVKLEGPLAEQSGVVAGMSGSPVYIDGKLAGAVALKLGVFTKEAIAGVQPIEQMLAIEDQPAVPPGSVAAANLGLRSSASLVPIDVPLVAAGFSPEAFSRFSSQLAAFGFTATAAGGTAKARPDDAELQPGDMAGITLVSGDLSLGAGCTVTAVTKNSVLLCGHPLFGSGEVSLPMVRAHVVTTLSSAMESTKILTMGGPIGTLTQDRSSGIMGTLGASPATIPVSLEISGKGQSHMYHFQVAAHPKLSPLMLGLATYTTLVSDAAYNDGTTLRLEGSIQLAGHPAVALHNLFAPTELPVPDGFTLASGIQTEFAEIINNPFEKIRVNELTLHITAVPDLRSAMIENAWSEKTEVHPGETISIKALLRPYRGAPFIREIPITVPPETAPGELHVLVSDAAVLNQAPNFFAGGGQGPLASLDDLIHVLNSERGNDRLYVSLLHPAATLVVDGKEMPGVPPSAMQIMESQKEEHSVVVSESRLGEWSAEVGQVVTGQQSLTITVQ